ncbi:MAG TPA: hypothetical protein VHB21_17710 [Minicystis sp.]|nr:hypothetical protein [Minicystis sp.]
MQGVVGTANHLETCPDLGPECASNPKTPPIYHHVGLFVVDTPLDVSLGVRPWLAVEARIDVRVVKTTPTFTSLSGQMLSRPNDIHHHDETLAGPTDSWLVLRAGAARGGLTTAARLGVSLPTGKTEPNPYVLAAEGKWHEHIQFGSGTLMPIVGGAIAYALPSVELEASLLAIFSLYANDRGYRAPTQVFPSARVTVPFLGGALRPYVGADLAAATVELWDGVVGPESPVGRADVLVGGGVGWAFSAPWTVDVNVRGRAASLTNAVTWDYPGVVWIGLGAQVDVPRAPAAGPTRATPGPPQY